MKGFVKVNQSQFEEIMRWGVKWCAENGYGWEDDASHVEEGGFIKGADPIKGEQAGLEPGHQQLGTLGSGNHYLEIQVVDPSGSSTRSLGRSSGSSATTRSSS